MNSMSSQSKIEVKIRIAGIDLAWGERMPDGVCALEASSRGARIITSGLTHGDDELLGWVAQHVGTGPAFLTVDAPLVGLNPTGAGPVDALTRVRFGKERGRPDRRLLLRAHRLLALAA